MRKIKYLIEKFGWMALALILAFGLNAGHAQAAPDSAPNYGAGGGEMIKVNECVYTENGAQHKAALNLTWNTTGAGKSARTDFELLMRDGNGVDLVTAFRDFGGTCDVELAEKTEVKVYANAASVVSVDGNNVADRTNGMKHTGTKFHFEQKANSDSAGIKLTFFVIGRPELGKTGVPLPDKDTDIARLNRGMPTKAYGWAFINSDQVEQYRKTFGAYPFLDVQSLEDGLIIQYPLLVSRFPDPRDETRVVVRVWMGEDGSIAKTLNKLYGGLIVVELPEAHTVAVNAVESQPLYWVEDGEVLQIRKGINNFRRPNTTMVIAQFPAALDADGSNGLELYYFGPAVADPKKAQADGTVRNGSFSPLDDTLAKLLGGKGPRDMTNEVSPDPKAQ